jgi:hydroxymethylglutaryl-CoA lyase
MGAADTLNLASLIDTARWLEGKLGHPTPAMLGRAGIFPAAAAAPRA